jgi:pimeloyl-ACP methyl ester carboxylesterase
MEASEASLASQAFRVGALEPLDALAFCTTPHRRIPEALRRRASVQFVKIPLAGGTGQGVWVRPHEAPQNSANPMILFLHGLADDCVYPYWHWMEVFAKSGFDVLSVEWDGHGATGASALDFQESTRTIPLLLQKLFGEPGKGMLSQMKSPPPLYLVGHSIGASLALIAATRPEILSCVRSVVAVSPVLGAVPTGSYRSHERAGYLNPVNWVRDLGGRVSYYGMRGLQGFSGFGADELPTRLKLGLPIELQASQFLHEAFHERRLLRHIKCPVLWIHAMKDRFAPYEKVLPLMEEIPTNVVKHLELKRTHLGMAFSLAGPKYISQYVQNMEANL